MVHHLLILVIAAAVCGCGKAAGNPSGKATSDELNQIFAASSIRLGRQRLVDEAMHFPRLRSDHWIVSDAGNYTVAGVYHNSGGIISIVSGGQLSVATTFVTGVFGNNPAVDVSGQPDAGGHNRRNSSPTQR